MNDFWAWVSGIFFGIPAVFAIGYILWLLFDVLYGKASCLPTTCQ